MTLDEMTSQATPEFVGGFFRAVAEVARMTGVIDTGYRILANNGGDAHQEVMHLHIHVFGGRLLGPMLKRSS